MLYTATAMAGTFLLCKLTQKVATYRLIIAAGTLGTLFHFSLAMCLGLNCFITFRMLQTAMVAAILPLVIASFSSEPDGKMIGFLNSSRFAGNGLGPMIATSVLSISNLTWLYLSVGSMSLMALLAYSFYLRSRRP
jgi:hypothetical protein